MSEHQPLSPERLAEIRTWLDTAAKAGMTTTGDLYARDLLAEVERLRTTPCLVLSVDIQPADIQDGDVVKDNDGDEWVAVLDCGQVGLAEKGSRSVHLPGWVNDCYGPLTLIARRGGIQ